MACASRRDWAYAHVATFRPKVYDYGEPGADRLAEQAEMMTRSEMFAKSENNQVRETA